MPRKPSGSLPHPREMAVLFLLFVLAACAIEVVRAQSTSGCVSEIAACTADPECVDCYGARTSANLAEWDVCMAVYEDDGDEGTGVCAALKISCCLHQLSSPTLNCMANSAFIGYGQCVAASTSGLECPTHWSSCRGVDITTVEATVAPTAVTPSPTALPTASITTAPVRPQTAAPVATVTAAPVNLPTTSPVAPRTAAPAKTPTATPVAASTAAPSTARPVAPRTASPTSRPTVLPVAAITTAPGALPAAATRSPAAGAPRSVSTTPSPTTPLSLTVAPIPTQPTVEPSGSLMTVLPATPSPNAASIQPLPVPTPTALTLGPSPALPRSTTTDAPIPSPPIPLTESPVSETFVPTLVQTSSSSGTVLPPSSSVVDVQPDVDRTLTPLMPPPTPGPDILVPTHDTTPSPLPATSLDEFSGTSSPISFTPMPTIALQTATPVPMLLPSSAPTFTPTVATTFPVALTLSPSPATTSLSGSSSAARVLELTPSPAVAVGSSLSSATGSGAEDGVGLGTSASSTGTLASDSVTYSTQFASEIVGEGSPADAFSNALNRATTARPSIFMMYITRAIVAVTGACTVAGVVLALE